MRRRGSVDRSTLLRATQQEGRRCDRAMAFTANTRHKTRCMLNERDKLSELEARGSVAGLRMQTDQITLTHC